MKNELQKELTKLDSHLSCEIITKESGKATLSGDTLILPQHSAGDVLVKYDDVLILTMLEVEGTPAIKTEVGYFDKDNAKLIANLIELCGAYLPDSKEEE